MTDIINRMRRDQANCGHPAKPKISKCIVFMCYLILLEYLLVHSSLLVLLLGLVLNSRLNIRDMTVVVTVCLLFLVWWNLWWKVTSALA